MAEATRTAGRLTDDQVTRTAKLIADGDPSLEEVETGRTERRSCTACGSFDKNDYWSLSAGESR